MSTICTFPRHPESVSEWLSALRLSQYTATFDGISVDRLRQLDDERLQLLGVPLEGSHRLRPLGLPLLQVVVDVRARDLEAAARARHTLLGRTGDNGNVAFRAHGTSYYVHCGVIY